MLIPIISYLFLHVLKLKFIKISYDRIQHRLTNSCILTVNPAPNTTQYSLSLDFIPILVCEKQEIWII